MAPPTYADLGKAARDVFGKGFHFGLVKLDVKGKTSSGLELSSGGNSHQESGKVTGNLELKNKICPEHGVTLTSKWTTDNILNSTIDVQVRRCVD
jgi:voltage-dependent anion channel protein 2